MKKKYLHEYTLRELLIEEKEPEEKKGWLDRDNPYVPNFIETPVKNWIKEKLKTTASTATRMERENDELVKELCEKSECWRWILTKSVGKAADDIAMGNTEHWPHETCPWFQEHIDKNKLRFTNLVSHVLLMDSENKDEFDRRVTDMFDNIKNLTGDTAGSLGDLDALLQVATQVIKVINFTSDQVTSAAGTSAKAAVIMKLVGALIPKDIDRVRRQIEILFAGQDGGVPAALGKEPVGTTQPLVDEMIRLWFYEYEKFVLEALVNNQEALPEGPIEHFEKWIDRQYKPKRSKPSTKEQEG